jgi:hypothetical protein
MQDTLRLRHQVPVFVLALALERVSLGVGLEFIAVREGLRVFHVLRDADGLNTLFKGLNKKRNKKEAFRGGKE